MNESRKFTTIRVSAKVKEKITRHGKFGETIDEILDRLLT